MSRATLLKAVLLATGLAVFGFGIYYDDRTVRWGGIAFLAAAMLLRLVTMRRDRIREDRESDES